MDIMQQPATDGPVQHTILSGGFAVSPDIRRSGEPDRIRTCDPLIKSQLLYQLSYGPITGRLFR